MSSPAIAVADPRPGASLWHFLENQFVRYRATWRSTILSSLLFPAMFLLAIGFGLGSQVDDTSSLGTADYKAFVGPAVLAGAAMLQAGGMSLWQTLGAIKWEGTYHATLCTPLTARELATGHILWIGFRVLVGAVLYMVTLLLFGLVATPLGLLAPVAASLTGMAFAAPISAWSAAQESDDSFGVINRVVLTPLFLFSGAFYPLEQLPSGVEALAKVLPVSHGVELCRGLVNNSIGLAEGAGRFGYLLAWILVGWVLAMRSFKNRLSA